MKNWPADADRSPLRCAHCDLPVQLSGGSQAGSETAPIFCCLGCRMASTVAGGRDGARQFLEARLLLASFLAMGVMTFSLVLYGETLHQATGDEVGLAAIRNVGRMVLALFALPVLALLGLPLVSGAWADLRRGVVRMDGLIVLATFAAYGLSLHATWAEEGEVYYETATMVLVLVTFGRRLEAHARTHGRDAAELLAECLPTTAHRLDSAGTAADAAPDTLVPGDVLHVLPGEALPADVVVAEGQGQADCSHLTGESEPVAVGPGTELPAGALNGHGLLVARVLRTGARTALGRIHRLLDAPIQATSMMRQVDRWAGWLTALAISLAIVGGLRSGMAVGLGPGLRTALSVLLVACPCALGLATPLAYRALRAALARHGLLINDVAQLETVGAVSHVIFDKTGTLTEPERGFRVLFEEDDGANGLARLMAHSGHALSAAAGDPPGAPPRDVVVEPGAGVRGLVDDRPCQAGRPDWLTAEWPAEARAALERQTADPVPIAAPPGAAGQRTDAQGAASPTAPQGQSLVGFAAGGRVQAVVAVQQRLRPGAGAVVTALGERGLSLEILSGDRQQAVADMAATLGIAGRPGLSPTDKLARIAELQDTGARVLVVGDGINDAPALRAADVAVAMGCGTASARAQAGIEVVSDDLQLLPRLFDAAKVLRRTVRGNVLWSLAYNGVALALATTGRLHPLVAVVAMIVSSLVVSLRSYRLLDWAPGHVPVPAPVIGHAHGQVSVTGSASVAMAHQPPVPRTEPELSTEP